MNIFEAVNDYPQVGLFAPWYFGVREFSSASGNTTIVVEHGYLGNTQLIEVVIQGEFIELQDVENALIQFDVYDSAINLGPIGGGGFPKK